MRGVQVLVAVAALVARRAVTLVVALEFVTVAVLAAVSEPPGIPTSTKLDRPVLIASRF